MEVETIFCKCCDIDDKKKVVEGIDFAYARERIDNEIKSFCKPSSCFGTL